MPKVTITGKAVRKSHKDKKSATPIHKSGKPSPASVATQKVNYGKSVIK